MIGSSETLNIDAIGIAAETLLASGQLRLRVTGGSMLPALIPGDVVQFHSCAAEHAEPGDVVLFRREDRFVVHRVVTKASDGLLTQGDALAQPDLPVSSADVIGKVVGVSRRGIIIKQDRRSTLGLYLSRRLLGRSDLATRLLLRWYRPSTRAAA
jgi:signal peptidase